MGRGSGCQGCSPGIGFAVGRLLIVSNRLPFSVGTRKGELQLRPSSGGLATAVSSIYQSRSGLWIGWPGGDQASIAGQEDEIRAGLLSQGCYPVFLSRKEVENYYNRFCNSTIWPLFHYFAQYAVYSQPMWHSYQRANEVFCDAVANIWEAGDDIWVHDYHLMLLPRLLRQRLRGATIGFFLHIPFPSLEVFRLLPWRRELLEGLLGADLVGFHTYDYAGHFLSSVRYILGHESVMGKITAAERVVKVDAFPVGIDYERYAGAAESPAVEAEVRSFREKLGDCKIVLSMDRLDYTKGIIQRLEAFGLFLDRNPQYREKLTMVLVVVPSRTMVGRYAQLKKQIDELVGGVNGRHGTIGWTPIWYLYRFLPFDSLVALYTLADVALVTPLRDGMNLIAKEYVAARREGKGVLILSETAGAAKELAEAVMVNVNNQEELVAALEQALNMPEEEQIERNTVMQRRLRRYDVQRWAREFCTALELSATLGQDTKARFLSVEARKRLLREFRQAKRRVILLDYDGTLVPFAGTPSQAPPGDELLALLGELARSRKSEVVIVSGRDRSTLERWFGGLKLGLVAEHGAWIRQKKGRWELIEQLSSAWKEEIRPILELYVDRTPGSFVEEKEYSLVWHYRRADPNLAQLRASEVVASLEQLTPNLHLQVQTGSNVVEVKNAGVNKGRAALRWVSRDGVDFVLAIGDDWTDEAVFQVLPDTAWSIKVGFSASAAKFNLSFPSRVITLLQEMVGR